MRSKARIRLELLALPTCPKCDRMQPRSCFLSRCRVHLFAGGVRVLDLQQVGELEKAKGGRWKEVEDRVQEQHQKILVVSTYRSKCSMGGDVMCR